MSMAADYDVDVPGVLPGLHLRQQASKSFPFSGASFLAKVFGLTVDVYVEEGFFNDTDAPLEAVYTFWEGDSCTLYSAELQVGSKPPIVAQCKPKQEVRTRLNLIFLTLSSRLKTSMTMPLQAGIPRCLFKKTRLYTFFVFVGLTLATGGINAFYWEHSSWGVLSC